jgi:hypothetical protein
LSVVERILNLELLDRVRSRYRQAAATVVGRLGHVAAVAIRIHAVQHEVVVAAARAVGANLLAPGSEHCRIHNIRVRPSRQPENLRVIAIHKWQGFNRLAGNHPSECDIARL